MSKDLYLEALQRFVFYLLDSSFFHINNYDVTHVEDRKDSSERVETDFGARGP